MAEGLITPEQLRRITEEKEMEKMHEALEKKRRMDEERHHFRDTFMHQDLPRDDPRARERFAALVQRRRRARRARSAGIAIPERVLHRWRQGDQQLRARLAEDA